MNKCVYRKQVVYTCPSRFFIKLWAEFAFVGLSLIYMASQKQQSATDIQALGQAFYSVESVPEVENHMSDVSKSNRFYSKQNLENRIL